MTIHFSSAVASRVFKETSCHGEEASSPGGPTTPYAAASIKWASELRLSGESALEGARRRASMSSGRTCVGTSLEFERQSFLSLIIFPSPGSESGAEAEFGCRNLAELGSGAKPGLGVISLRKRRFGWGLGRHTHLHGTTLAPYWHSIRSVLVCLLDTCASTVPVQCQRSTTTMPMQHQRSTSEVQVSSARHQCSTSIAPYHHQNSNNSVPTPYQCSPRAITAKYNDGANMMRVLH